MTANLDTDTIHATLADRIGAVEPVLCRMIAAVREDDVAEFLGAIDEYAGTSTTMQWQTELVLMLAALVPDDVPFRRLTAHWRAA